MEVDSPTPSASPSHSSPSSRLSVVCSLSDNYSGHSSGASSPMSRRNSISDHHLREEMLWDRRVKGGKDHGRTRVEQDLMEQRLLALARENERLRAQLSGRDPLLLPSATTGQPFAATPAPFPALPSASLTYDHTAPKLQALYPGGVLSSAAASAQFPMLQLCQLQAALQQQYGNAFFGQGSALPTQSFTPSGSASLDPGAQEQRSGASSAPVISSTSSPFATTSTTEAASSSAFHPFHKDSVIKTTRDRISPDSSTDSARRKASAPAASQSLLGALLSNRRPSPTVPQSSTERRSGINSPPPPPMGSLDCHVGVLSSASSSGSSSGGSSKSDSDSHSSPSLSPSEHRSDDQQDGNRKYDKRLLALANSKRATVFRRTHKTYVERRMRNNEAAKRCRANRRAVFEYRSRRVEVLENENHELRKEVEDLKREIERCQAVLVGQQQKQPPETLGNDKQDNNATAQN